MPGLPGSIGADPGGVPKPEGAIVWKDGPIGPPGPIGVGGIVLKDVPRGLPPMPMGVGGIVLNDVFRGLPTAIEAVGGKPGIGGF